MHHANPGQGLALVDPPDGSQPDATHSGGQQSALQLYRVQQADGGPKVSGRPQGAQSSPSGRGSAASQHGSGLQASRPDEAQDQEPGSQRLAGGGTPALTTQEACRTIDATVEKGAPVIDAPHDKVESARDATRGARDTASPAEDQFDAAKARAGQWIGATREAVLNNPVAAIASAFLVGAIYTVSRRR